MARKQINIRAGFDLSHFSTSSQSLQRELKKVGTQMKNVGRDMSTYITAPLAIMGGLAVKTFADFEQSMAKVKAVSGATGAEFDNLNKLAKDLGISTRYTALEVSDLMLEYSKLGFSAAEIEAITQATLNLSLATGEDLAKSAEVAGSTLRAFGLDANNMLHVTDVMAQSFNKSALGLDDFTDSMKYVAPVAASAGVSLEEASAMLAILSNNGIKGSQAGTSLRRIITDLGSTGGNVAGAIGNLANKGLTLTDAMDEVGRTAQTALIVLGKGVGQIKPLTEEFENSDGAAAAMAAIMDDTLQGSMLKMTNAVGGLSNSFGEVMAPAIGHVAEVLKNIALKFSDLNPYMKTAIVIVAGLTASVGPLLFVIGSLTIAFAKLSMAQVQTTLIIVGVIATIALLVTAFLYVRDNLQAFKDFFYNTWVKIANGFIDILKSMVTPFLKFANILGINIGTGINAFLDSFKLKSRDSTAQFGSFKEMLQNVKKDLTGTTKEIDKTTGSVKKLGKETEKTAEKTIKLSRNWKGLGEILESMRMTKSFDPNIKLDISNVVVDTDTSGILSDMEELGKEMGSALSDGLKALAVEGLTQFGEFLGTVISGGDMTVKDFGRGLLDSLGKFMGQFGEAMIAMGIAQVMLDIAIKSFNPALAIIGGVALVAAGAAISNLSQKGIDKSGASNLSGGGGLSSMGGIGGNMQPIVLETKISGRDLVLVQSRSNNFRR
jgi:phage-related minor tail protein